MEYERETVRCLISKYKGKYGIEHIGTIHYVVRVISHYGNDGTIESIPKTIVETVIAKNHKRCVKKLIKLIRKLDEYYGIKNGGV